ncbi:hypothetical protein NDU88_004441 [Pleurodeles waltl]|uniref:Uncharacterized protein n=1 Tax=Pleurodeles waltl TaxID=8319 RepID=A0AAV7RJB3_PLEWA|nr:hypothetical protein NDU88_004441 [Pleurodeles waltl]
MSGIQPPAVSTRLRPGRHSLQSRTPGRAERSAGGLRLWRHTFHGRQPQRILPLQGLRGTPPGESPTNMHKKKSKKVVK